MAAVVGVGFFGVEVVSVGDERVVAPVGPQLGLGADRRVRRTIRRSGFRERLRALVVMVPSATWACPPRV